MNRQSAFLVLFLLALFAVPVVAQFETAEVLGTIHDPSGQVVAKATVTLTNQGTGIQATTTTDDSGNYDFNDVKIGLYTITVEAAGFDKVSTQDVRVDVNARQRVDLTLQLGTVSQSVNVSDAASILETDSSEHSQVVETQEIRELPLNGRNYADLALLATNTIKSPIAVAFSPSGTPREGAFNVNGMRSTYNNFLLDGIDNNAYGTSNQGIFGSSGAAVARRHGRVSVDLHQLQRRIRPRGRRGGECRHEDRHQRVPRHRLRVLSQHGLECHRIHV